MSLKPEVSLSKEFSSTQNLLAPQTLNSNSPESSLNKRSGGGTRFLADEYTRLPAKILLIPYTVEPDEEALLLKLSYEYRSNFSLKVKIGILGEEHPFTDNISDSSIVINKIWEVCRNSQERVQLIKHYLRVIEKIKKENVAEKEVLMKKALLMKDGIIEKSKLSDSYNPDLSLKVITDAKSMSGDEKSDEQPDYPTIMFDQDERKARRLQRKRQHFEVKASNQRLKDKKINLLQNIEKIRKSGILKSPSKSSKVIDTLTNLEMKVSNAEKQDKPLNSRVASKRSISTSKFLSGPLRLQPDFVMNKTSANHSKLAIPPPPKLQGSEYDKYYFDMKEKLISMVTSQNRSKHLQFSTVEGGIALLSSQMELVQNINSLDKQLWNKDPDTGELKITLERLPNASFRESLGGGKVGEEDQAAEVPQNTEVRKSQPLPPISNRNKKSLNSLHPTMFETRYDEKLRKFVAANLPITYNARVDKSNAAAQLARVGY